VDGLHHELQGGVNNGSGLFGVEPFDQRRGAFEIGKESRDRLALAVGCTAGVSGSVFGPNAFG
jgi:hypothetical protein